MRLFFIVKVGAIYLIAESGTLLLVCGIIHCYELVSAVSMRFLTMYAKESSSQKILIVIAFVIGI